MERCEKPVLKATGKEMPKTGRVMQTEGRRAVLGRGEWGVTAGGSRLPLG